MKRFKTATRLAACGQMRRSDQSAAYGEDDGFDRRTDAGPFAELVRPSPDGPFGAGQTPRDGAQGQPPGDEPEQCDVVKTERFQ